jgi:hypothetical protein
VSEETMSQRRRCSHGSAILSNLDVSCSLGFRFMTRARVRNLFFGEKTSRKNDTKGGSPSSPRGRLGLEDRAEPHLKVKLY